MARTQLISLCRSILRRDLFRFNRALTSRSISTTSNCLSSSQTDDKQRKVKVLYDGGCSLCAQEMKLVKYLNKKKDIVELKDITKPGYNPAEHNNITYKEAMAEFHIIDENNEVHKRVPAMHTMYASLEHGWSTFYTNWPILAPLFDKAYGWFARNRLRWTKREHMMQDHPNMQGGTSQKP